MTVSFNTSAGYPRFDQPLVEASQSDKENAANNVVTLVQEAKWGQQDAEGRSPDKKDGTTVTEARAAQKAWDTAEIALKHYLRMYSAGETDGRIADLKQRVGNDLPGDGAHLFQESANEVDKERAVLPAVADRGGFDLEQTDDKAMFADDLKLWSPEQWDRFDKAIENIQVDDKGAVTLTDARDDDAGATRAERTDSGSFRFTELTHEGKAIAYRPLRDEVIHEYVISDVDYTSNPVSGEVRVIDLALPNPKDRVAINDDTRWLQDKIDAYNDRSIFNPAAPPQGTVRVVHSGGKPVSIIGLQDYLKAENVALPDKLDNVMEKMPSRARILGR